MRVAAEVEEDTADEVIHYGRDQTERQWEHGCFEIFKLMGWVWFGIPRLSRWWAFSPAEARSFAADLIRSRRNPKSTLETR